MSRWKKVVPTLVAAAALTLSLLPGQALADQTPAEPEPAFGGTPNHATMLADFAAPVWQDEMPDGVKHVDIDATLDALEEANANSYAYIISGLPHYGDGKTGPDVITGAQWADFPAFAAAAAERDIDVYIYMPPPSIGYLSNKPPRPEQIPGLRPFGWDYVQWAEELAKLAVEYPNIGGLFIDDFDGNTELENSPYSFAFTPDYVREMSAAARVHDPDFKIYGIVYGQSLQVGAAFRDALDGVVFPYRAHTGDPGTADASKARSEGEVYSDISHCATGEYCLGFTGEGPSPLGDAATATRQVSVEDTGSHTLEMQVNNDNYLATCPDGSCFEFGIPAHTPTTNGDYIGISQEITITDDGPHELSIWVDDDFRRVQAGYHMLEVLVDGELVIQRDMSGADDAGFLTADVTGLIGDAETAELTVRFHNPEGVLNFGYHFWVDDVQVTGAEVADSSFDDRESGAWTWSNVGEAMSAAYTTGEYDVEVLVDGDVAATFPVKGYEGWHGVRADLTQALAGKASAEVGVRMVTTADDVERHRHVWVDDLTISGTGADAASFDAADTWELTDGAELQVERTRSHEAIWMLYASRLSADVPGHQPTPEYVRSVQTDGLDMMREGLFDGSLIYVLNLSAPVEHRDGIERGIIGELYGDYHATDLAECDVTVTGSQYRVVADEGRTCIVDATVGGTIQVSAGAELLVVDSSIGGSLVSQGSIAMCDSTLNGSLETSGAQEVRIGATPSLCAGNVLSGGSQITGTTEAFTVSGTTINGSLACSGNITPSNRGVSITVNGSATNECADL